jgi:hypothetical protein
MLGHLCQESRDVAAKGTKFRRDRKVNDATVRATLPPPEYFSDLVFSALRRAASGDGR